MREVLVQGKSKIVYDGSGQSQGRSDSECSLILKFTDVLTAGNGVKKAEIAGKGRVNTQISQIIFEYLADCGGISTHFIRAISDDEMLVKKAEIIPIEVIVRNTAAGGFSRKYGVAEGAFLDNVVVEFCRKSDELGDPMMNESQITAIGLASAAELDEMRRQALRINEVLTQLFSHARIRLVDFKLEFGRCENQIILCDEISPDSCRLWDAETSEKLDKDRFRHDLGDVLEGYQEVLERLKYARYF